LNDSRLDELVRAARAQDTQAIAALCEDFYPKVFRYVRRRVRSEEDAEDLAGEVCVHVIRALPKQTGFFPAWVFRIASNLLTDTYRRRKGKSEVELSEQLMDTLPDPMAQDAAILPHELSRALDELTPDQREIIHLRFIEGFSANEIAQVQGRSAGAVRVQQFRALEILRKALGAPMECQHGK